jgi:hypothetical protein
MCFPTFTAIDTTSIRIHYHSVSLPPSPLHLHPYAPSVDAPYVTLRSNFNVRRQTPDNSQSVLWGRSQRKLFWRSVENRDEMR